MVLFFDTETTGLYPGEVCQLTYIMQEKEEVFVKNFFFNVKEMPLSAEAVHGFSIELLKELSGDKDFSYFIKEIGDDFNRADVIVSHNFQFDEMFLRASFERNYDSFLYNESLCTMKTFTPICKFPRKNNKGYKYPKLNELCEFLGIDEDKINQTTQLLFKQKVGFHDARFDTVAVYLAVNEGIKRGYLTEITKFL